MTYTVLNKGNPIGAYDMGRKYNERRGDMVDSGFCFQRAIVGQYENRSAGTSPLA